MAKRTKPAAVVPKIVAGTFTASGKGGIVGFTTPDAPLRLWQELEMVKRGREAQAQGRSLAHKNIVTRNLERDRKIVRDERFLRAALTRRDRHRLEALLRAHGVPKAKWSTFKRENIAAALAKKHELSTPRIRTILKNWKVR